MDDNPFIFYYKKPKLKNSLYLDRDGVLNEVVMRGEELSSPRLIDELNIVNDIDGLGDKKITNYWNLIIITNQPDLSRGLIDIDLIKKINNTLLRILPFNIIYVCPHKSNDLCRCRKPKSGMIEDFRSKYPNSIEKELFIGDQFTDMQCAKNVGVPFILRSRTYNRTLDIQKSRVISNLYNFHKFIN